MNVYYYKDEHARPICIDSIAESGLSTYSHKTPARIVAEYPGAAIIGLDEFATMQDAYYRSGTREIAESDFWEALGELPPVGWKTDERGESFKCAERTCGNITNIYARTGRRYFALSDDIHTTHEEIMQRVRSVV